MATAVITQPAGALRMPGTVPAWLAWVGTVDHKKIGVLYLVTGALFFLLGGLEALLMRVQLAVPNNTLVHPETFNQLFTMHGTTMIFLAIMPIGVGFANFVVPIQIGTYEMAYPRLNAFSYWLFLFSGIFLNISFIAGGAPNVGWFGYAPLTEGKFSVGHGVDFWAMGLQLLGVASLAGAFNFIITILKLRAPGMTFFRMPVFTWMTLVVSFLIIFAFPTITVALFLLLFDRLIGTHFFAPSGAGDPLLWQHLFWFFGHPEVYILILPAMGIISEILPVFSRKPLFGYEFVVYSGIAIGFIGFTVWAHHMFAAGLGVWADAAFAASTMIIAVPTGVKIFNWIATTYGGSLNLKTAMLFAIGFIAMFIIGGISGIFLAAPPVDLQETDTYFVVAHLHYVLFGGSIMGLTAGAYYWFPKITGRLLDERLGKLHFWLTMIGFNATFLPMHWLGWNGMPRRIYTYPDNMGWNFWNYVQTLGAFTISLALLVFIWNMVRSLRRGEVAGDDPWGGGTMEWTVSSPPSAHNFHAIPTVFSRYPNWDLRQPGTLGHAPAPRPVVPVMAAVGTGGHGEQVAALASPAAGPTAQATAAGYGAEEAHEAHAELHLPGPTLFPLIVGLGLVLVATGIIFHLLISVVGLVYFAVGVYGWIQRATIDV